jgi:hypothetical protein
MRDVVMVLGHSVDSLNMLPCSECCHAFQAYCMTGEGSVEELCVVTGRHPLESHVVPYIP